MKPWRRLLSVMTAAALFCMAMPVSAAELTPGDGALSKDVVIGDANGDGKIDTTDARLILQHAVGKIQLDTVLLPQADADGNGEVDTTDARMVLQFAVGKITEFPERTEEEVDFRVLDRKTAYLSPDYESQLFIAYSVEDFTSIRDQIEIFPKKWELDSGFFDEQVALVVLHHRESVGPMTIVDSLSRIQGHLIVHTTTGYPAEIGPMETTDMILLSVDKSTFGHIDSYTLSNTDRYFSEEVGSNSEMAQQKLKEWYKNWLNEKRVEKPDQNPPDNREYGVSVEGWKYTIYENDGYALIDGYQGTAAEVTIPDFIKGYPVTGISSAWCSKILTKVYFGKNMRYVGDFAFGDCTNLTQVVFNDGLERIGWESFAGCKSLQTVCIPDSVTKILSFAFRNCTNLTSVIIGDGVTEISHSAFATCINLSQVILGENVKTIDEYAFSTSSSLKTIVIPASVTSIASNAFYTYGAALESIYFAGDCPDKFTGLVLDIRQKLPVLYCPRGNNSWDALEQRGAMNIADIVRYDP